jgi:hypothetical protein
VAKWLPIGLATLLLLLAVCQFVLPPLTERQVSDRIEENGGTASVSVEAFPAPRLLFGDGDSLRVRGRGLEVDLADQRQVLERLDGFDSVDVRITDMRAEPLDVDEFELVRDEGEGGYRVRMTGETTPREVVAFLGSRAGGALGGVLGDLAADGLPGGGDEPVPVDIEADVVSRDGEVAVASASGSVAGVPAGPLAELVVEAVVQQL